MSDETPVKVDPRIADSIQRLDHLGRIKLHRVGLPGVHGVLFGMTVDRIPDEFWTLDVGEDGFSVAEVACPCGKTPSVKVGAIAVCVPATSIEETRGDDMPDCPRGYVFTGEAVYVLNSPKPRDLETPAAS